MEQMTNRISFRVFKNEETGIRFEERLLVFFGLTGECSIYKNDTEYLIKPAGILIVNPFELYSLKAGVGDSAICMQLARDFLQLSGWKDGSECDCYIRSEKEKRPVYETIRAMYARIFDAFFQNEGEESAEMLGETVQFMAVLQNHFLSATKEKMYSAASMQRLRSIVDEIHSRWNEDISLTELAKKNYLSAGYLSRLFQKNLKVSFSQYVRNLRLNRAAYKLIYGSESVTQIAYECGFGTPGVFIEAFSQRFGITPGQYRKEKNRQENRENKSGEGKEGTNLSALVRYIKEKKEDELLVQEECITVECGSSASEKANWIRILNIGYARDGLMALIQEQIIRAHKEIGFEYIRFHGIFDQDMHIYAEDENGIPEFDFTYVTMLFDFIMSTGLKPYVEFSFMPERLAKDDFVVFDRPTIISGYENSEKWKLLVQETLRFFIERYGRSEVETWRFTTIGKGYAHVGKFDFEEHERLFCETYKAVKSVDKACLFGGPGGFAYLVSEPNGVPHFFETVIERKCIPDFVTIQCYPHAQTGEDVLFMDYTLTQQSSPAILSNDDDFLMHSVEKLRKLMEEYGIADREIYLEEANSTLWQRDLSSDTCYKAAWLAKNVCATRGKAVFGYWLLTDLIEERSRLGSVFHGGYGLMTYSGVPKAGYEAMRLLARMGKRIIDSGESWMLTAEENGYQLMVYNYCSYSNLYRYRYKRLEKPEDAYLVFENGKILRKSFELNKIPDGEYRVEYFKINKKNGSSFDSWIEIGAPRYPKREAMDYLKSRSLSEYSTESLYAVSGLKLEIELKPHEIALISVKKIERQ